MTDVAPISDEALEQVRDYFTAGPGVAHPQRSNVLAAVARLDAAERHLIELGQVQEDTEWECSVCLWADDDLDIIIERCVTHEAAAFGRALSGKEDR